MRIAPLCLTAAVAAFAPALWAQEGKPPRPIPPGYAVTDTAAWGNPVDEGEMGILRRGTAVIDTIDLGFGVAFVGHDSLVFQRVRVGVDTLHYQGDTILFDEADEFVLWTPSGRSQLRDFLPHFDSYWSGAEFFDGALHYWGIARGPNDASRLYAMRYDFRSMKLDSVYVRDDDIATDYRYYLGIPKPSGELIAFGRTLIDPAAWQIVRRDEDP